MERLVICGGGHVGLELAHIAARLDFDLWVLDDREEFANSVRFSMARTVLCAPFPESLDRLERRADDFFVLVTRGHQADEVCLARVLEGPFAYAGMIGSRGKVAAVMADLTAAGFPPALLARVHAPIGLKLGGQSPAEIAVSIAAQLVQVRAARGSSAPPPPGLPGILVTIVKKTGSAPRGPGAWMLVGPDGSIRGTVGGGAVEARAIEDARDLWARGGRTMRKIYDLSSGAAGLGMVCGGVVEAEFRRQAGDKT